MLTSYTTNEYSEWRNALLSRLLAVSAGVGFILLVPSLVVAVHAQAWLVLAGDILAFAAVIALCLSPGMSYELRAGSLVAVIFVLSITLFVGLGPYVAPSTWLFLSIAFAALLLGSRGALWAGAATTTASATFAVLLELGFLEWPISTASFIVQFLSVGAAAIALILAARFVHHRIEESFAVQQQLYNSLATRHAETKAANADLKRHVKTQETLVQELHHRVKNNLQLLDSLMSIEEKRLESTPGGVESRYRGRVRVLALVHDETYADDNSPRTSMSRVLHGVWNRVWQDHPEAGAHRRCDLSVVDKHVSVERATAIALFAHEVFRLFPPLLVSGGTLPSVSVAYPGASAAEVLSIGVAWRAELISIVRESLGCDTLALLTALGAQAQCRPSIDSDENTLTVSLRRE